VVVGPDAFEVLTGSLASDAAVEVLPGLTLGA
jgi:hypothetical protein